MRRFLTTLMILLVVLVAGFSALVMLVNPNDFRAYMVQQVAARSGYQLQLDGPLRWHVWPQLSILSGRMALTAEGASEPLVRADNMRLDVALWPLLSHQLKVEQVMLKGAVIQLTPQTEAARREDAPVAPKDNTLPDVPEDRGWSFDISSLRVADSVLVFQHEDDEQITVRDIRLQMEQDEQHRGTFDFSGRVNRDQRDLSLSFNGTVDASDYPHNLTAGIEQLNWQLQGADLPKQGIQGQGQLQAQWQEGQKRLSFSQLSLSANDSTLTGQAQVTLSDEPEWAIDLQFGKLNLDNLLPRNDVASTSKNVAQTGQQSTRPRPVIASRVDEPAYQGLKGFSAALSLRADNAQWRGMAFTGVSAKMTNQAGLLNVVELQGKLDGGEISLPGTLDARAANPRAVFQPRLEDVEIGTILNAFDYPIALTGKMSLAGDFSGADIDAQAFRHSWQGQAHVEMRDTRMEGMNFQQLVQQAVTRSGGDVQQSQQNFDNATRLDRFVTDLALDNGKLTLGSMEGQSAILAVSGNGALNLVEQTCDTQFNVRVLGGWTGESKLIDFLKETPVPLRVYGKWQALNYNLQVDQILRKHLQDEAKRRLSDWADRNKETRNGKDVKKLLDKL
ncbi:MULTISPECIES: outer membrane assembly protein AsmA [Citrobacter]|uniref:outer membrane assembly protein AsmA n=1 Tax=Citrobacter TaxID=544 RepID=UPI000CE66B31|nr:MULTISPECIES: outer membrane assembly protein AsmA [Citrobacter]AVE59110.1 outer membrane assembly protein AsmA [Citrobacter koseri]ELO4691485.1 outer membrane assembly protein AsmA [Citrobacter koseri]EMD6813277.1 outer membrane assembly protein AsmA [Citrobacter koseri]MBJ8867962.1 outer membrane assembly protein AsmA [Citrobacter koseri]MBJ9138367.1 outer membrane assembly protein AsmA [Citrobacter koseri]